MYITLTETLITSLIKLSKGNDELSGVYPSLLSHQSNFAKLVADLRGDGDNHVNMLLGIVDQDRVLKLGHRVNSRYVKVN